MDCRIVLAQTNPRLGDLQANLQQHLEVIQAARAGAAELVVFPELSLTGYFLKDQVFELGLELESPEIARVVERSGDISIAFGFVERSRDGRLYNAFAFAEKGSVMGVHRKVHLVSYGIFDEQRDFAAGERFEVIESRLGRFGPLICEDLWHAPGPYLYFLRAVDCLLVARASPMRGVGAEGPGLASQRTWGTLLKASALMYRTWVVYAGRVGWEDGVGFGGSSCVFDPFGNRSAHLAGFEVGQLSATLDRSALDRARVETPLRRDEKPWILARELAREDGVLKPLH